MFRLILNVNYVSFPWENILFYDAEVLCLANELDVFTSLFTKIFC